MTDLREPATRTDPDLAIRALFLVAAIGLLWVAQQRYAAFIDYSQTRAELHTGIWLTFVASLVVAGVAVGFSVRLPSRGPYAWVRVLILAAPSVVLLAPVALFSMDAWTPPGWLFSFVGAWVVQSALGVFLGLAVAAGFPTRAD